jgi:hypothetical protein
MTADVRSAAGTAAVRKQDPPRGRPAPEDALPVRAGDLSAEFAAGGLRYLRMRGIEVARRIVVAVRDRPEHSCRASCRRSHPPDRRRVPDHLLLPPRGGRAVLHLEGHHRRYGGRVVLVQHGRHCRHVVPVPPDRHLRPAPARGVRRPGLFGNRGRRGDLGPAAGFGGTTGPEHGHRRAPYSGLCAACALRPPRLRRVQLHWRSLRDRGPAQLDGCFVQVLQPPARRQRRAGVSRRRDAAPADRVRIGHCAGPRTADQAPGRAADRHR